MYIANLGNESSAAQGFHHVLLAMYRSISKPPIPPPGKPRGIDFFEKFWSNSTSFLLQYKVGKKD